jgi:general stress protein 26
MHQHGHNDPNAGKLFELIKDVKIAMMTTVEADGTLHSRPMHSQEADEHGDLWFFTQIQSPKMTEISRDNEVNLAYSDPGSQTYVSVSGKAEIVRDKAKIEEKWSEPLRGRSPDCSDPRPSGERRVLGQPILHPGASVWICQSRGDGRVAEAGRSGEGQPELISAAESKKRGRFAAPFL